MRHWHGGRGCAWAVAAYQRRHCVRPCGVREKKIAPPGPDWGRERREKEMGPGEQEGQWERGEGGQGAAGAAKTNSQGFKFCNGSLTAFLKHGIRNPLRNSSLGRSRKLRNRAWAEKKMSYRGVDPYIARDLPRSRQVRERT